MGHSLLPSSALLLNIENDAVQFERTARDPLGSVCARARCRSLPSGSWSCGNARGYLSKVADRGSGRLVASRPHGGHGRAGAEEVHHRVRMGPGKANAHSVATLVSHGRVRPPSEVTRPMQPLHPFGEQNRARLSRD